MSEQTVSEQSDSRDVWREGQPGRVPPRQCIANAREALNRAYGFSGPGRHTWTFIAEALDWQRRALEQILAEVNAEEFKQAFGRDTRS